MSQKVSTSNSINNRNESIEVKFRCNEKKVTICEQIIVSVTYSGLGLPGDEATLNPENANLVEAEAGYRFDIVKKGSAKNSGLYKVNNKITTVANLYKPLNAFLNDNRKEDVENIFEEAIFGKDQIKHIFPVFLARSISLNVPESQSFENFIEVSVHSQITDRMNDAKQQVKGSVSMSYLDIALSTVKKVNWIDAAEDLPSYVVQIVCGLNCNNLMAVETLDLTMYLGIGDADEIDDDLAENAEDYYFEAFHLVSDLGTQQSGRLYPIKSSLGEEYKEIEQIVITPETTAKEKASKEKPADYSL